jgi:ligand-binding sensor domain-containing protein
VLEGQRGTLWIGTSYGLYGRRADGSILHWTAHDGLPEDHVSALQEGPGGTLWVGTMGGLCQINANQQSGRLALRRLYHRADGLLREQVLSLLAAEEGKLWVTSSGLQELDPGATRPVEQFQTYTAAQGLSRANINVLFRDREGNLWAGTDRLGVMKIPPSGFSTYTEADGVEELNSLLETPSGELCAIRVPPGNSGQRLRIHWFDGQRFRVAQPAFPPSVRYFGWGGGQIGLQDRWGEWWIATGEGLSRFPRTQRVQQLDRMRPKAQYTMGDGFSSNNVFRVFEDSGGNIWTALIGPPRNSVARWERSTESWRNWEQDEPPGVPTAFACDREGSVWIGFWYGCVTRYRDGQFTRYAEGTAGQQTTVTALFCDRAGRLWVGTSSQGVVRIDDAAWEHPRFTHWTAKTGSPATTSQDSPMRRKAASTSLRGGA